MANKSQNPIKINGFGFFFVQPDPPETIDS
jgi:hypothetical protein